MVDDIVEKSRNEYRNLLIESYQKINASFDKTLITLSGGALGLSLTFIKDIIGAKAVVAPLLVLFTWVAWTLSLMSLLVALFFGTIAYKHALEMLDKNKLDPKNPGGIWAIMTQWLNGAGVVFFICGIVTFIMFVYKNLGG